jgi:hypothetical protein
MKMCVGGLGFQYFSFLSIYKNSTMSLKSEKYVGNVSNSSININSDNEYGLLHCDNHFTIPVSVIYT